MQSLLPTFKVSTFRQDPTSLLLSFSVDFLLFWEHWKALPKDGLIPNLSDYLDHAPPRLQPAVTVVDFHGPHAMKIRLVGTRTEALIGDITGSDATALYREDLRARALAIGWKAATQPCGLMIERILRSRNGRLLTSFGLALPVRTKNPETKTFINLNDVYTTRSQIAWDDKVETIQSTGPPKWIDVGGGIPAD